MVNFISRIIVLKVFNLLEYVTVTPNTQKFWGGMGSWDNRKNPVYLSLVLPLREVLWGSLLSFPRMKSGQAQWIFWSFASWKVLQSRFLPRQSQFGNEYVQSQADLFKVRASPASDSDFRFSLSNLPIPWPPYDLFHNNSKPIYRNTLRL